jgi:hypothetical protein
MRLRARYKNKDKIIDADRILSSLAGDGWKNDRRVWGRGDL